MEHYIISICLAIQACPSLAPSHHIEKKKIIWFQSQTVFLVFALHEYNAVEKLTMIEVVQDEDEVAFRQCSETKNNTEYSSTK